MNKKGFSTIELLVSFVIISFVAISMFKTVVDLLDKVDYYQLQAQITILNGNITNSVQKDMNQRKLYGIDSCGCNCYDITYQDLTVRHLAVDRINNTIQYGGIAEKTPANFTISGDLVISRATLAAASDKNDTILRIYLPISSNATGLSSDINIIHQYDSRNIGNLPAYVEKTTGGICPTAVNIPVLATGMTPVKWDGSAWIETEPDDSDWYNYTTTDKKWANAKTADGSMWVWIPRYAYQIASGYHSNSIGTVNIKFLRNKSNVATDGLLVPSTPTYTGNAQTNYIVHPAFTFGNVQLAGIWVAKFEASGTSVAIDVLPSVASLRGMTVNDIFDATRAMETNNRYGWGTSGNGIDTHLIKNTEWGAVAYLAQSIHGKNTEVWINPSSTYVTGCAGTGASVAESSGCSYYYDSSNGQQASTTGNVYGIYDMSGGSREYVAGYANNAYVDNNGLSLYNANSKYKDIYTVTTDDVTTNYTNAMSKKGDAVYETSSSESDATSWYSDSSHMLYGRYPWFLRGGSATSTTEAGLYAFLNDNGSSFDDVSFRPVLMVSSDNIDVNDKPPVITLSGEQFVAINVGTSYNDAGATALDNIGGDITSDIVITGTVNPNVVGSYTITYDVINGNGIAANQVTRIVTVVGTLSDPGYIASEGVNGPALVTGMTPIKWNGTTWVTTTLADPDWYDYTTKEKEWANARTSDGSMWVWIPRYIYRIRSGWNTDTTGTIDVQFTKGVDDDWNNAVIGSIDKDETTSNASDNKYTNHPAFDFDLTKLTGIWVAKFEATASEGVANGYVYGGTCPTAGDDDATKTISILPNVSSWRCASIGNMFTSTRSMEQNDTYGWGTTGTNIDTHLMKNTEWGAVAYLSKSDYGQGINEIWTNPADDYKTGCAGTSATSASTTGCTNTYDSPNGLHASTTGNIYGIYDMSGGSCEYVAAYVANNDGDLGQGSSITGAASQYKDVYTKGTTDNQENNYALAINQKGDAVYETSNSYTGSTSWFDEQSYMPFTGTPWFIRGGYFASNSITGAFFFSGSHGIAASTIGFRPVVAVNAGL